MTSHILNKFGFKKISTKEVSVEKVAKELSNEIDVSIIQPKDHKNPQIVFKLSREILTKMKWDITDRISLMSNPEDHTVALMKANKKDKNSFAISTQGTTVAIAKQAKRGGVVKVGWREELCEAISAKGTFPTTMEIFGNALIVKLPQDIFQVAQ